MDDLWATVAAERGALADDLAGLDDQRWSAPSLCDRWTVRDVLAHLTGSATLNPATFFLALARAGFSFDTFADQRIARHRGSTPADTLAGFRAVQHSRSSPPGPKATWLGEVVVHGEDIRRPLGIRHQYDAAALVTIADFYKRSNALIGSKSRIAGMRLVASDADWRHGTGDEVTGPLLSLVLAMTGRSVACDDLSGPGVERLRSAGS